MYPSNIINWNEHYLKRGKTYYIIRLPDYKNGLILIYCVIAGHIAYALSKGWIPVVDMQNYPNIYLEPELLGKENSWEYYFCQPLGVGLDEAYAGDNIILSSKDIAQWPGTRVFNDIAFLIEWRTLVKLGFLKIKPEMYEDIMKEFQSLFKNEDRVLGVKLRGTDFIALKPAHHPVQPPIEIAINTVRDLKNKWNCNKIFLATEDHDIFLKFKEAFGDTCITINKVYPDYKGKGSTGECKNQRKNDAFLQGKEYLTEIVILSKCKCFVAAMCSGSVGAMLMTEGFEQMVVFNCGYYPDAPPSCSS